MVFRPPPIDPNQGALFADVPPQPVKHQDWAPLDSPIWHTKRVKDSTINYWVRKWHYSHHYPGGGTIGYGFYGPDLMAVCTTSNPTNVHGVADKFGLTQWRGNVELSRLVVHPDAPKRSASCALGSFMKFWSNVEGHQWMFSYADTGQGHHGGIYQAINSVYVGVSEARPGYLMDGQPIHPRTVVSMFGTQRTKPGPNGEPTCMDLALRQGHVLVPVPDMNTAKHTYIIPLGGPATRRAIRRALEPYAMPYPKRPAADVAA